MAPEVVRPGIHRKTLTDGKTLLHARFAGGSAPPESGTVSARSASWRCGNHGAFGASARGLHEDPHALQALSPLANHLRRERRLTSPSTNDPSAQLTVESTCEHPPPGCA